MGHDLQYNIGTFLLATHLTPRGSSGGVLFDLLSSENRFTFLLNRGEDKEPIDLSTVPDPSQLVTEGAKLTIISVKKEVKAEPIQTP